MTKEKKGIAVKAGHAELGSASVVKNEDSP
jgi:hypothetical protein